MPARNSGLIIQFFFVYSLEVFRNRISFALFCFNLAKYPVFSKTYLQNFNLIPYNFDDINLTNSILAFQKENMHSKFTQINLKLNNLNQNKRNHISEKLSCNDCGHSSSNAWIFFMPTSYGQI